MSRFELSSNSYGKSNVRFTKVIRNGSVHEVIEASVDVVLEGDFEKSYSDGDNSQVVATDSIKNTVYVLAKETEFSEVDTFADVLVQHFVNTYPQVKRATAAIEQTMFARIPLNGQPHDHAFTGGQQEQRIAGSSFAEGDDSVQHWAGVTGLVVLKTTASEFHSFVDDRFRTLKDATDRIFATTVEATWHRLSDDGNGDGGQPMDDPTGNYEKVKTAILEVFATHHSLAVQQTLQVMGEKVLEVCSGIDSITLTMPNQHRVPFNLEPFGHENTNEIFVPMDEPYGLISGTVERKA